MKIKTDTPIESGQTTIMNELPQATFEKIVWTKNELKEVIKEVIDEILGEKNE